MLGIAIDVWRPVYGGAGAFISPASEFGAGTTGAWFTAYDNTYLKVNTDGTGGNVADGGMVGRWDDRSGTGNHIPKFTGTTGCLWNQGAQACDFFWRTDGGASQSAMVNTSLAVAMTRGNTSGGCVAWVTGTPLGPFFGFGPQAAPTAFALEQGTGSSATTPNRSYFSGAANITTGLRGVSRRHVISWRNNGTDLRIWVDGQLFTGTAISAASSTTLALGAFADGGAKTIRLQELVFFNASLSDTKMAALNDYLRTNAGSAGDPTRTVDVLGDSLTIGQGSQTGVPWHFRTSALKNRSTSTWRVSAYDGAYLFTGTPITAAQLVAGKGSAEAVAIIWIGTNDVLSGARTGAQWATDLINYSTTCRASGVKTVACTLQHFATNDAQRIAGNSAVVAASSSFDAVVRLDTALPNAADTTLYTSDGVHLKDAGYEAVASAIQTALSSI